MQSCNRQMWWGYTMKHHLKRILLIGLCSIFLCFSQWDAGTCLAGGVDRRVNALLSIANTYSKQGKHVLALEAIGQAIKLRPGDFGLYYKSAFEWARAGNYVKAIEDFTKVIRADRVNAIKNKTKLHFAQAYRYRADCFMGIGYMQKAAADYIQFLGGFPNGTSKDGKVWCYLAETFSLMGRNGLALKAIQKGLATGSHWTPKLISLQRQILSGEKITPHKPLSN
jgi:tetratricopeptide (TPR) repeat protein